MINDKGLRNTGNITTKVLITGNKIKPLNGQEQLKRMNKKDEYWTKTAEIKIKTKKKHNKKKIKLIK